MGKYVLNVSNSTRSYIVDKKVKGYTARVAKLNSQKILEQNTALKYGLTPDTKVTLKKAGSKTSYKMNWIEPKLPTGSRFLAGWTTCYGGSSYKSNTDRIKRTHYFGISIFNIVFVILASGILYFRFENSVEKVISFNALLFILSLLLNSIISMAKDDLNDLATKKITIVLNNFFTSFPTWLTLLVTAVISFSEGIIITTLEDYGLVVAAALIILFVFLKFVFDCKSDFNKYDYRKLVESTFTEIKEEDLEEPSTPKEILHKERKRSLPKNIKDFKWKKTHVFLHLFLLILVLMQYLFFKKIQK